MHIKHVGAFIAMLKWGKDLLLVTPISKFEILEEFPSADFAQKLVDGCV